MVILTCTGAKSGKQRNVTLLYVRDTPGSGKIGLIASNYGQKHHPGWYYNLKANPQAKCTIAGVARDYLAYEASGDEYASFWQRAIDTYPGFSNYQERAGDRHIPIMILEPIEG